MPKVAVRQEEDIRDAFFDEVYAIAGRDTNVVFITADADAFSLKKYQKDFPSRFINAGVAEQNMITVAAGLALSGKKVFIYALIPFIALRCYEQIKVNICSMNLAIVLIGAGAGLSFGNDGPTHHAVCDVAVMRTLPEMSILNPSDGVTASAAARLAHEASGPVYVRLDKGVQPALYTTGSDFSQGFSVLRQGADIVILATGLMVHRALEVAHELSRRRIEAGVVDLYRIKPVDEKGLSGILKNYKKIVTLEENSIIGGIGSLVSEILADNRIFLPLKRVALRDEQCFSYGDRDWLHRACGIDKASVLEKIIAWSSN